MKYSNAIRGKDTNDDVNEYNTKVAVIKVHHQNHHRLLLLCCWNRINDGERKWGEEEILCKYQRTTTNKNKKKVYL